MLKSKILLWLFSLKTSLCNCRTETRQEGFLDARPLYYISQTGKLPAAVNESSGLARVAGKDTFWTQNDGGKTEVFEVDMEGNLVSSCELRGIKNMDWEEIDLDTAGNLLIGDIGNNFNNRQDLAIYKINLQDPAKSSLIQFKYGNQTEFPPEKRRDRIFDCEAFFSYGDSLYLFSKNWGSDLQVRMYSMPNKAGNYVLEPKLTTRIEQQVTAAAVAPDGKTFALLTYGKLLLYSIEDGKITFDHPLYCLKLARKQTEGIVFVNNTDMLVSNEQGELYLVSRNKEVE